MLVPLAGATTLTPATVSGTLKPGESILENKVAATDPTPLSKADVIFSFDLTGSMSSQIENTKAVANNIMTSVNSGGRDVNFGVVSMMDYPYVYNSFDYYASYGSGGDWAYKLGHPISSNQAEVAAAINALPHGGGDDGPQDYERILYESYSDPAINWRSGAKKILVMFGDDVPHDYNINLGVPGKTGVYSTGGDPGRDAKMDETSDPTNIGVGNDDLELHKVLDGMKANGVALLYIDRTGYYGDYWKYWTGSIGTGSGYYQLTDSSSADVTTAITTLITSTVSSIKELKLVPDAGYESWVSAPDVYTDVGGGVTKDFKVTITVPAGTPAGTYNFKIHLIGDGTELAYQTVSITVPGSSTSVPEFPTVAIPVAAVLGLIFVFGRRKE